MGLHKITYCSHLKWLYFQMTTWYGITQNHLLLSSELDSSSWFWLGLCTGVGFCTFVEFRTDGGFCANLAFWPGFCSIFAAGSPESESSSLLDLSLIHILIYSHGGEDLWSVKVLSLIHIFSFIFITNWRTTLGALISDWKANTFFPITSWS